MPDTKNVLLISIMAVQVATKSVKCPHPISACKYQTCHYSYSYQCKEQQKFSIGQIIFV